MAAARETGASSPDTIDFLVIGAPKAGTTSLFEYLRGHPEIDLPPDKEAPYFSDERRFEQQGWDEYLSRAFPTPKRGKVSGTITPQYLSPPTETAVDGNGEETHDSHTLPRRIHAQLPSARLIAILRDPVERAHSHHAMMLRTGLEQRPFPVAVDELLRPDELARCRSRSTETNCYVVLGEYGRLLDGYYGLFPGERILVLFTEDLARDPLGVLRRIYDFLEVSPDHKPRNTGKRYNVAGAEYRFSRNLPQQLMKRASANPLARTVWRSLSPARKSAVLSAYRRYSFSYRNWNHRGPTSSSKPSAEDSAALERLREHYVEDGRLLEKLLGHSPPWETGDAAALAGAKSAG